MLDCEGTLGLDNLVQAEVFRVSHLYVGVSHDRAVYNVVKH